MRGAYVSRRCAGRRARRELGFTLVELLTVIVILGILACIAVPIYLNVRKAAWNAAAQSDLKNAQLAIETESAEMNGTLPASFELAAGDTGRTYTLKSFTWGDPLGNRETSSQITLSPDVSLCYTPGTTFLDKKGRPIKGAKKAYGVKNGLTYRVYATSKHDLSVYYMYDSMTGLLTREENPKHVAASVGDSEGGYYRGGTGPKKGKYLKPYGVITSCDIETSYHMYGN